MVNNYFESNIKKRKHTIYTRNGRWIILLIILLICILNIFNEYNRWSAEYPSGKVIQATLLSAIPSILACLIFSIYQVPKLFKNYKYKKFWISLFTLTSILCLMEVGIIYLIYHWKLAALEQYSFFTFLQKAAYNNFGSILGTASYLFFIELLEEINLKKEMVSNAYVEHDSIRKLRGTKVDLPFMTQSLRAIRQGMDQHHHSSEMTLLFADVLRYKLYGYENIYTELDDELKIIRQITTFYNYVISKDEYKAQLEIEGDSTHWQIQKQSLLNLIHPFLSNTTEPLKNLLIYILVDTGNVYVAIEFKNKQTIENTIAIEKAQYNTALLSDTSTFEINNTEDNNTTINVCLTLKKPLNV